MLKIYKFMLASLCMLLCSQAFGQQVSSEEAMAKARNFFNQSAEVKAMKGSGSRVSLKLAYESKKGDECHFYVFNSTQPDGGFVIVGGDEAAREILGYSFNGTFDYNHIPDNFRWWLSQYDAEIEAAIADVKAGRMRVPTPVERAKARKLVAARADVPKLMKTTWNQSAPYNNLIPTFNSSYEFVTGCVATAMAQVMKYHECPSTKGSGSKSYSISYSASGSSYPVTFAADFGNTTYDWDNMLNKYTDSYSDAEANAVATLMYHAGVSVNMDYNTASSGGSGASISKIPDALSTYFGYDKSAQHMKRTYFADDEWFEMIYQELVAGRPVVYGGQNTYGKGGHAFVCHGYNAEYNTYAINWGWGSKDDGYFTLMGKDGLQPSGSGIGGAGTGASYTSQQEIVINVKPDAGGSYPLEMYCINGDDAPYLTDQNGEITDAATVDLSSGNTNTLSYTFQPWNLSHGSRTFQTSVMLKDVVTGTCIYTENKSRFRTLPNSGLFEQSITISPSDFYFNGTYEVYPVVRESESDDWHKMYVDQSNTTPTITIVGGQEQTLRDVTFEISGTSVPVRGTLEITHDKFYNGNITYTAVPEGIVSIDEDGVVTALSEGNVAITVSGDATSYFNATTQVFNVAVTPYVMKNVEFSISDTQVLAGKTLQISCLSTDYTGTVTYSSSDASIASVDANGVVTGVCKGNATITITAAGNELYLATTKTFDVKVTESNIRLIAYEIPNNGYVTMNRFDFAVRIKNNSSKNWSNYYAKCKIPFGSQIITVYSDNIVPFYSGNEAMAYFNIYEQYGSYFQYYFKVGDKITTCVEDFDENEISDPITFTFCNELTIDYNMTSAGWGTICLPFEAEIPEGLTAYNVPSVDGNKLVLEEAESFEMNTPYLLSGTQGTYSFTGPDTPTASNYNSGVLVGNTYLSTEANPVYAPEGSYVLQNNTQGLGFYKVANANKQKVRQYSAYLVADSYSSGDYFSIAPDATSIEAIAEGTSDAPAYNLNGIRVNSNAKGFVIVNGKLIYKK